MRTFVTCLLAVLGFGALASPLSAQSGPQYVYINSQRIIAEAPGAQEAQQAFEKDMAQYQAELRKLEDELKAMMTEFEQKQVMLSPEAKQEQQEKIVQKQQEYQQRAAELQQKAAQRQQELVEPIMQRIEAVITELREEKGYTMIFDAAAGALIAADPSLDITDEVLARLRTTAKNP